MNFEFELGERVKDRMTNFQGVITVRTEHITGCDRYCVRPAETNDGEYPSSQYFDEQRLVRVDENGEVMEDANDSKPSFMENLKKVFTSGDDGASGGADQGKPTP